MPGQEDGKAASRQPLYQCPITGPSPYFVSCIPRKSFGDHWHSELEILYLMPQSTPVTVVIEGQPYPMKERDMIVIPSTAVHRLECVDDDNRIMLIEIGYPLLGDDFLPFTEKRFADPFYSFSEGRDEKRNAIEPLLDEMAQNLHAAANVSSADSGADAETERIICRMKIRSAIYRIAANLLETMTFLDAVPADTPKRHPHQIIQTVIFYIRDHFAEPITVKEAAKMAGYEKTRFCRLFREITGKTFHRYLTDLRLEAAYPLLCDTSLPIGSIGKSVGIPSIKTFSRLVRLRCGMSPREIRCRENPAIHTNHQ